MLKNKNFILGLFLVSCGALILEISYTRIFSVVLWYHFAFMIISIVLFGLSVSGIFLHLFPEKFIKENLPKYLARFCLIIAVTTICNLVIITGLPLSSSFNIKGLLSVSFIYLLTAIPFFFMGLNLALIFKYLPGDINRLYAVNLIGSAIGCLLSIPLLNHFGGPSTIIFCCILFSFAALQFSKCANLKLFFKETIFKKYKQIFLMALSSLGSISILVAVGKPTILSFGKRMYNSLAANAPDSIRVSSEPFDKFVYFFSDFYAKWAKGVFIYTLPLITITLISLLILMKKKDEAGFKQRLSVKRFEIFSVFFIVALSWLILINARFNIIDTRFAKGNPLIYELASRWNASSRVNIQPGNTDRSGKNKPIWEWGMSKKFYELAENNPKLVVNQYVLGIDGPGATTVTRFDGDLEKIQFVKYDVVSMGLQVLKNRIASSKILIIGCGGGKDILSALYLGARDVTGVEINHDVINFMRTELNDFSGRIYSDNPYVKIVESEGRSFIRRDRKKYDLILLTIVDSQAATSAGAYSLAENHLYTTEALSEYFDHLRPDGLLTISRWGLYIEGKKKQIDTMRLMATVLEILDRRKISDPGKHIVVIQNKLIGTMIAQKSPFTENEIRDIAKAVKDYEFEIVYAPYFEHSDPDYLNMVKASPRKAFFNTFDFNIEPVNDDKPFFFQKIKFRNLFDKRLRKYFPSEGIVILLMLSAIITLFILFFIFVPLLFFKADLLKGRILAKLRHLLYFFCIGIGFMLIEVELIQKFTLFLGHPVYALSIVLMSILLFSGIGSYLSGKLKPQNLENKLRLIILCFIGIIAVYLFIIPQIFNHFLFMPLFTRIIISVLLLSPAAMLGVPFPVGIKIQESRIPGMIPWIWGINGAASVLGSCIALIIAITLGFNTGLIAGCFMYLAALIII